VALGGPADRATGPASAPRTLSAVPAEPSRRPRRHTGRWVVLLVVVVGLAWAGAAAFLLVQARRHADAGLEKLQAARERLTPTELIRGKGLGQLEAAQRDFGRAHSEAGSPLVAPFKVLPFVGRQVRSVDALTGSAAHVVTVGAHAMRESRREVDQKPLPGPARVALVDHVGAIADRSRRNLRSVDLGPDHALLGPLAHARERFASELSRLRTALDDVGSAATGVGQMVRGPSHYLVFAANNGEMRAGSGMLLSVGVLTFENGRFSLGEMVATGDITLPAGAVPIGGDLAARWGWADPNQEWRNLMMSPRFDANAALATRMWKALTGTELDGVIAIDPIALRSLLAAEGPVTVDGQQIDEHNVVGELLFNQYVGVTNDNPVDQARRERLSRIARATVGGLDQQGWDAGTLVDQLRIAGEGRHVLAWSSRPAQQRAWKAAGISGQLGADSVLVAVLSRSGNKLDQFVTLDDRIEMTPGPVDDDVTLHLVVTNGAPPGIPLFVGGAFPGVGLQEGEYKGILSVDLPGTARDSHIDEGAPLVAVGPDGPARVVATEIRLARGQRREVLVHFKLPRGARALRIEPSARVPAIQWQYGADKWTDDSARTVRW
jgi:hypothetical protein